MVSKNMVLRRMFWPRKNEVTRKWRRLHNAELYALYSPNVIPVIRTGRKREGRRPLKRPRRRCEDNIKMDLREVGGVTD